LDRIFLQQKTLLQPQETNEMRAISNKNLLEEKAMPASDHSISRKHIWTGRILSVWLALFLLVDAGMKLFKVPVVVKTTIQLGYHESVIVGIGLMLLASTLLYLVPRTSILGAVLLTGYLGGAVATRVRVGAPLFNILFAVVVGILLWVGLWLRDRRVRELLPMRTP
jgi:hypothetical protein